MKGGIQGMLSACFCPELFIWGRLARKKTQNTPPFLKGTKHCVGGGQRKDPLCRLACRGMRSEGQEGEEEP